MVIEFDPVIFDSTEHSNKFALLFNLCFINRRYDIFIDKPLVENTPLYQSLSSGDKEVINEYYEAFITNSRKIDFLISTKTENDIFDLDEAIEYFGQQVLILVENSLYDSNFVTALVRNFSKRAKKIRRHLEFRWAKFDNGGGCTNMANVINQQLSSFQNRPKEAKSYLRYFVLVDSDSTYPGEEKQERVALRNFLEAKGICYHILYKREMENYMPDELFADIDDNEDLIEAYMRLSPVQKDYFDLEKGFHEKKLDAHSQPTQELYSNVTDSDMTVFRKGGIKMPNFKSDFSGLFLSDKVTRENLQQRVIHQGEDPTELEEILDKINGLL